MEYPRNPEDLLDLFRKLLREEATVKAEKLIVEAILNLSKAGVLLSSIGLDKPKLLKIVSDLTVLASTDFSLGKLPPEIQEIVEEVNLKQEAESSEHRN